MLRDYGERNNMKFPQREVKALLRLQAVGKERGLVLRICVR